MEHLALLAPALTDRSRSHILYIDFSHNREHTHMAQTPNPSAMAAAATPAGAAAASAAAAGAAPASTSQNPGSNAGASNKDLPRDARVIGLILASLGVSDAEPGVVAQLLEFAHRACSCSLLAGCSCRHSWRGASWLTPSRPIAQDRLHPRNPYIRVHVRRARLAAS